MPRRAQAARQPRCGCAAKRRRARRSCRSRRRAAAPSPAAQRPAQPIKLDPFFEVRTPERNYGPAQLAGGAVVTPLARRLAAEAGIDLSRVTRLRPARPHRGARRRAAAQRAPRAAAAALPPVRRAAQVMALYRDTPFEEVPLDGMRKTIAARLVQAKQTIPHFYLTADVEIGRLLALREEANAAAPKDKDGSPAFKLSVNDLVIKAWAAALQRVPAANAVWAEDRILRFRHSDIGVAVAIEGGLITPVIRQAETKSLTAISAEMRELAERARARRLKPHEYQGGASAISNLGMYGVREFAAIINPPHATILAVGAARRQAVESAGRRRRLRQRDDGDAVLRSPRGRRRARRRAAGGVPGIRRAAGDDAGVTSHALMTDKIEVLLVGPPKPTIVNGLAPFTVHRLRRREGPRRAARRTSRRACAPSRRACTSEKIDGALMAKLPQLEIVSTFGVGYDHIDVTMGGRARRHGHQHAAGADRGGRRHRARAAALHRARVPAGRALSARRQVGRERLSAHQGDAAQPHRRHGRHGRIGQAIARRLDAMQVPVVYHSRRPAAGVSYRHYPKLLDMARDVDVLLVITPGGAETKNLINAEVLKALGPDGILINMARGSVVDEPALIKALQDKTIMSAGLDVYVREPEVPAELIAMENVVLFPHLGSASVYTRTQMDQLVVDNLLAWAAGKPPLTPVPETPWPPKQRRKSASNAGGSRRHDAAIVGVLAFFACRSVPHS